MPPKPDVNAAVKTANMRFRLSPVGFLPSAACCAQASSPCTISIPRTSNNNATYCVCLIRVPRSKTLQNALVRILLCEHTMYTVGLRNRTPSKRKLFCITYSTDGKARRVALDGTSRNASLAALSPSDATNKAQLKMSFTSSELAMTVDTSYGFTAFRYENFVTRTETVLCIVRMSSTSAWRQAPLRSQLERRLLHPSRLPVLLQVSASFDPPTLVR